jgi:hypothetical protein
MEILEMRLFVPVFLKPVEMGKPATKGAPGS